MGIKSLTKFLKDKFPSVFELIHISEYKYEKICIDNFMVLLRYKSFYWNPDNPDDYFWLTMYMKFFVTLREHNVHPFVINDVREGAPKEKNREIQKRREAKQKMQSQICDLQEAVDVYHSEGKISSVLLDFQKKKKIQSSIIGNKEQLNIFGIEGYLKSLRKQLCHITEQDIVHSKAVLKYLGITCKDASGGIEPEKIASDLCKQDKAKAVVSEDTDILACGAPVFIKELGIDGICTRICFEKLLKEMGFTYEQFLDFCIMCGTDYNNNIPKVGPVKSFELIKKHKSIENVAKNEKIDITCLNHLEVRKIFMMRANSSFKVKFCDFPNFPALEKYLQKIGVKVSIASIKESIQGNLEFIEVA